MIGANQGAGGPTAGHVLLTSAHGFVGSRITPLLLAAGHTVTGLARSPASAAKLRALGVQPLETTLEQPDAIAAYITASNVDAVIHTAFNHDFSKYLENIATDLAVIRAIGAALEGSGKPFIATFGLSARREDLAPAADTPNPRGKSEAAVLDLADKGVRAMVVRLPPSVHGEQDGGFVPALIKAAREKKVSAYVEGDKGAWSTVHVDDAAQLYVDVLNNGKAGGRYHAIAETRVPVQAIAEAIGEGLGVEVKAVKPDEVEAYVGPFFARFVGMDHTAEVEITKKELGWEPKGKGLIEDIRDGDYLS
jgi:nucleoside-diphosphate-sugar epimerase